MESKTEKTELEHQDREPIHLFIDEQYQQDSVIPVRWCICKRVFEQLREKMVKNPCLLLVVTNSERHQEIVRKVVPLDQMMEYISFGGPGRHRILATVVWKIGAEIKEVRKDLAERRHGNYHYNILDYGGNFKRDLGGFAETWGRWLEDISERRVEVAAEFFAKEPPKWLSKWVNFWFETKPIDQWHFRRRCILAFSIQPPLVLSWIIFVCLLRFLIAAFFVLCGIREINFKPIIQPFGNCTPNLLSKMKRRGYFSSVFFSTKEGESRPCYYWPLTPIFLLLLYSFLYLLFGVGYGASIWQILIIIGLTILGTFGSAVIGYGLYLLVKYLTREYDKDKAREKERIKIQQQIEREKTETRRRIEQKLSPLVCVGAPLKADLKNLPSSKRTVHLRFLGLKRMVCKPFARY